jgi:hypothetical protein
MLNEELSPLLESREEDLLVTLLDKRPLSTLVMIL